MIKLRDINKYENKIATVQDEASEHVQSEGEVLIKALVKKQTNTTIYLHQQLTQEKIFEEPKKFTQLTDLTSGETSLAEFAASTHLLENIEELKYYGLTSSEIKLYIDSKKGEEHLLAKHKNVNKTILLQQLTEINEKITKKKSEPESVSEKSVSRHLKEIALSVKPNSEETRLFQFALSSSSLENKNETQNHPINNLKDIEHELFHHIYRDPVPSLAKRRKRLKKLDTGCNGRVSAPTNHLSSTQISKWDVQEPDKIHTAVSNVQALQNDSVPVKPFSSVINQNKQYTCNPQQKYTIKDGKIIKLTNSSLTESNTIKEFKKLTEEEIKQLPRFQNYQRGTPSKVLYVKNISNSAKQDFVNLFQNDDLRCIGCKLLTQRMKGQAFVTYESADEATEALLKYNGYVLNGKPIVIQYGHAK